MRMKGTCTGKKVIAIIVHPCQQLDCPLCQQPGKIPYGILFNCMHIQILCIRQSSIDRSSIWWVMQPFTPPAMAHGCAWVIWASSELWSGEWYVPRSQADMHSSLAEAYGICTVLSFLHHTSCCSLSPLSTCSPSMSTVITAAYKQLFLTALPKRHNTQRLPHFVKIH